MQMVPSADGTNKYAMAVFSLLQFTPMPGALNASEVQALTQSRALNSISYSIITLWVLEIIFTFDKEIIYIWRRSWSPFRICFLCCRYFAIVPALLILIPPAPNNTYCEFLEWYIGFIIIIFSLLPSSGLLAIRLAKLYDSASMHITLTLLVLIETSSQVGTVMSVLPKVRSTYNPVTRACATNVSKSLWLSKSLIMVPYMILLCVYIGIAWRAFIRHCREKAFLYRVGAVRENFAPLYILFIRDGVVCYIANFCKFLSHSN